MDKQVGLREMRQEASEIVRRVEAGEEFVVTVSGRPAARLVPIRRRRWQAGREITYIFESPADPSWPVEHSGRSAAWGSSPQDPWDPPA